MSHSVRIGAVVVAGLLAAILAAVAGPRLAVAAAFGLLVAGGLATVWWLGPRLRRLERRVTAPRRDVDEDLQAINRRVRASARGTYLQLEALQNLYAMLPVRHRMPPTRFSCAAAPDLLLFLVSQVQERRPARIVELGSGASTLWMALALREFDVEGRIVSLDHDAGYGDITRSRLATFGLQKYAEVRHAPLRDLTIGGADADVFPWYDRAALDDVDACDLLLVDGPPGRVRPMARYPALPVLGDRMSPGGQVVADDYARPPEREMVRRWLAEVPGWELTELPLEKGAALLTRTS